jgi:hypothetical protein
MLTQIGIVTVTTVYTPLADQLIDVVAGLAPLYGYSPVPGSAIQSYRNIFIEGVLTDATLVTSTAPLSCSGSNCTSVFLPGGLELVRLQCGGPNSTLYRNQPSSGLSSVLVNNAPGYHLEFFPIREGFVFNSTTDCAVYGGTSKEAIQICIAANGTQVLTGKLTDQTSLRVIF